MLQGSGTLWSFTSARCRAARSEPPCGSPEHAAARQMAGGGPAGQLAARPALAAASRASETKACQGPAEEAKGDGRHRSGSGGGARSLLSSENALASALRRQRPEHQGKGAQARKEKAACCRGMLVFLTICRNTCHWKVSQSPDDAWSSCQCPFAADADGRNQVRTRGCARFATPQYCTLPWRARGRSCLRPEDRRREEREVADDVLLAHLVQQVSGISVSILKGSGLTA